MTGVGLARWSAFVLLVLPALVRVITTISPDLYFSSDPRIAPLPVDGLGPAGEMALCTISLVGFCLVLLAEGMAGRAVERRLLFLLVLPLPALVWHAGSSLDDLRLGASWFAAMATGVGAAHLARESRLRTLMIAVVMAMVAPLVTRALYQFLVEHPATVEQFERTRDSIFASRGWAEDSPQARLYIRRLEQNEATGWLGLSNVLGTLLATFAVFWVGVTITAARSRMTGGWIGLLGLVALSGMAGVALTFSKGAIVVTLLGVILCGAVLAPRSWRQRIRPWAGRLTIGLIALAIFGVIVRGALLGDHFTDQERSLLFRWHYWFGSARIFVHHPLFGVGPGGFKDAYLTWKLAINPEEVANPHSVFITWLSTLGVGGIGWIALTLLFALRLAPSARTSEPKAAPAPAETGVEAGERAVTRRMRTIAPAGSVGVVLLALGWWLNRDSMPIDLRVLFWPLAMAAFIGLVVVLPWIGRVTSWALLRWSAWAAMTVALVHSQIEMSMTYTGSATLLFLFLGAGAGAKGSAVDSTSVLPRWRRFTPAIVASAATIAFFAFVHLPLAREQSPLRRAYETLEPIGALRNERLSALSDRSPNFDAVIGIWQRVADQLKAQGHDPRIDGRLRELGSASKTGDRTRVAQLVASIDTALVGAIAQYESDAIDNAVEILREASNAGWGQGATDFADLPSDEPDAPKPEALDRIYRIPNDETPLDELSTLLIQRATIANETGDTNAARRNIDEAVASAQTLLKRQPRSSRAWARNAQVLEQAWLILGDDRYLDAAIEHQQRLAIIDPYSVPTAWALARLLDEAGRIGEAIEWYERTLQIDRMLALDPLKGLTDGQRREIERRIESLTN